MQTGNPFLEGVYTIKINATTPWTLSKPQSYLFNVTIACQVTTIKHRQQKPEMLKSIYYMNSGLPFEFNYQVFDTNPKCMTPPLVKYSAKTVKGGSLPPYIVFDSENYQFTIKENLKIKKETLDIVVTGSLPNGTASSQFKWTLKVDALSELIDGGMI